MKKKSALVLALCVVLLAAALIVMGVVGMQGKMHEGGCAVRVEVGATYDAEALKASAAEVGFANMTILSTNKTAFEFEAAPMEETALETAAQSLIEKISATYADAALAYAESFAAPQGVHHFSALLKAIVALAVLSYVYAALRFGWLKGVAAVLTSMFAAAVTGSICVLLSGVFACGAVLTAVVAGTAILAYVYTVSAYDRMKKGEASCNGELAVQLLVAVACVLVCVSCASLQYTLIALLGAVAAGAAAQYVAPLFWGACEK